MVATIDRTQALAALEDALADLVAEIDAWLDDVGASPSQREQAMAKTFQQIGEIREQGIGMINKVFGGPDGAVPTTH
jgi:hypothetical protein